jgi:hypothetical protein
VSVDSRSAYRERAGLLGRAVLAIAIAPAVYLMWTAIGLPGIPGFQLNSRVARADGGQVVFIATTARTPVRLNQLHDLPAGVAATAGGAHSTGSAVGIPTAPLHAPSQATGSTSAVERTPVSSAEIPAAQTVPSVALPLKPPTLPALQTPAPPTTPALPPLPVPSAVYALPTPPIDGPTLP